MIDNVLARRVHDLIRREDFGTAWPIVSDLLNREPDDAKALYLAGWIMRSQGHVGIAYQLFRRALVTEQKVPNIWMHYGACLHDLHRYEEAREAFMVVAKALPGDPMPLANIAASHVQQGHVNEAVEWADKALAFDSEHRIARIAKGFGCLALGRWVDGWECAAWLYGDHIVQRIYCDPEEPSWDGSPGKTVVVQADQGLGDQIMFAQCLSDMQKDCKEVILETSKRLAGLFKRSFPGVTVYATLKEKTDVEWPLKHAIDAHLHISHLGKYYRKADSDFPRVSYLVADSIRQRKWRAWLEQFPRPWVGLAWRGGIQKTNEADRSMRLADLAPIMKMGGTFINLAYQDVGREIALWNVDNPEQVQVPDIDNAGDYDETVALIAELDHVVTVTTTVAHVCGALGKRAYVLVNRLPQWRYAFPGEHMIWYPPSLRLYRQKPGEQDWTHAISRVAKDYRDFVLPLAEAA